ncbi:MAG: TPM domain-containing protein [Steroidobacteraceae bacterium]
MLKCLALAAITVAAAGVGGAQPGSVPAHVGRVNDFAHLLPEGDRAVLERTLAGYEEETSHQIAVLTVSSLKGESIESYSLRVANTWRLGRKGLDDGVLVTVAPSERAVRIEVGVGMSRYVTDADAKDVISRSMIPAFRRGDMAGGIKSGVERLLILCRAYRVDRRQLAGH